MQLKLLGKKVSNHSARRTCNLSIAGLSGHRNLLSLDDYSTISEEQQREMASVYMISKRLGQSGQQTWCSFSFRTQYKWIICQPLQNISRPRPNSNLSNEMSTYRQSFPSFATLNDDISTVLFAGATFQNCTFYFWIIMWHELRFWCFFLGSSRQYTTMWKVPEKTIYSWVR